MQALGEFLEKNCPSVSVKYVIKHKTEWSAFLDSVIIISLCNIFVIDLSFLRFRKAFMSLDIHDRGYVDR